MAALCVAYMLVLQLVFSGLALGAHAASGSPGHADFVLCQGATGSEPVPAAPKPLPRWPDCCQLVCQMGAVDLPVAAAAVPTEAPVAAPTHARLAQDLALAATPLRRAHPSRAPPLRA